MFVQLVQRRGIENVRAGFRAIERRAGKRDRRRSRAESWTRRNCRHGSHILDRFRQMPSVEVADDESGEVATLAPTQGFVASVTFATSANRVSIAPLLWTSASVKNAEHGRQDLQHPKSKA